MNIETISINPQARTIAINGEGYTCAPERFPALDPNVSALHWHPRKSRCMGAVSYHKGVAHGVDDFTLFEPFVSAWADARERAIARKAMILAEAAGDFDRAEREEAARKAQEAFEAHREERAREQAIKDAARRQEIVGQVIQQLGGSLPEGADGASLLPAQHEKRLAKLEADIAAVIDIAKRVVEDQQELARQVASIALEGAELKLWVQMIEAETDAAPTLAGHPEVASALGITAALDGNPEAWRERIRAARERGRRE